MDGGHEYPMDRLQPGDIAVIHYPSKRAIMEKMIKEADLEYEIEERISPVRGKLTLRSLYFSRSDSLGLWLYTLKKSEP
jgi:hypothetical protein